MSGRRTAAAVRFSVVQRSFRDEWFATIETSPDEWREGAALPEGESQSINVVNKISGVRGVAKPGPNKGGETGHCRAAHEKLAFDLAYLLALPVCLVVLWGASAPGQYKLGRSISAWAFHQSMKWNEAAKRNLISGQQASGALPTFSAMRVFHTWIGDGDRKLDHVNFNLDSPDEEGQTGFYDHGHSMSYSWKGPTSPVALLGPGLPGADHADVMAETADRICALPEGEIARLVNRLPMFYLPQPFRANILGNLLARRTGLRAVLGV